MGIWDGPLAHLSIPKEIECCYRHQKFHTLIIHLLLTWNGTLHTTIAQNNKYLRERERERERERGRERERVSVYISKLSTRNINFEHLFSTSKYLSQIVPPNQRGMNIDTIILEYHIFHICHNSQLFCVVNCE